jgi:plastocyanin
MESNDSPGGATERMWPTRRTLLLMSLPLLAATFLGCDKESAAPVTTTAPTTRPALAHGTIHGRVLFDGSPAPMPEVNTTADPRCGNHPAVKQESVVVNAKGSLKNVVVYLKGVTGDGAARTDSPPVIDQVGCRYVPHVLAVEAGQSVVFASSDATLHNVHVLSEKNTAMNRALTGAGQRLPPVRFAEPEFVRVKCDVHPWMNCWIAVLDGPYFAVTDDRGEFEIKSVPPGQYTLATWHERFIEPMTCSVTVSADQTAEATFTVKAP